MPFEQIYLALFFSRVALTRKFIQFPIKRGEKILGQNHVVLTIFFSFFFYFYENIPHKMSSQRTIADLYDRLSGSFERSFQSQMEFQNRTLRFQGQAL